MLLPVYLWGKRPVWSVKTLSVAETFGKDSIVAWSWTRYDESSISWGRWRWDWMIKYTGLGGYVRTRTDVNFRKDVMKP